MSVRHPFIFCLIISVFACADICEAAPLVFPKTFANDQEKFEWIVSLGFNNREKAVEFCLDKETDPGKKAFWRYFLAISKPWPKNEESLRGLLRSQPDEVFPDEGFLSLVPSNHLEIFMVPGQKMEPSILFELVEIYFFKSTSEDQSDALRSKKQCEILCREILKLPKKYVMGPLGDEKISASRVAYGYLLELHRGQECEIAKEILSLGLRNEEDGFRFTKWGVGGNLIPEALLAMVRDCKVENDEKIKLLVEIFSHHGKKVSWSHGGGRFNYSDVAMRVGSELPSSGLFFKKIIETKGAEEKDLWRAYACLGDEALKNGNRKKASKFYSMASKILGNHCSSNVDDYAAMIRKGAEGDFKWFEEDEFYPGQNTLMYGSCNY